VDRGRFARWDRQQLEDQRERLRTVAPAERLRETIAWSAVLLADRLARAPAHGADTDSPDPVGLGTRRA